ncbi:hypothetical protein [Spiroplasma endosymbiont of Villa modesta]|uniref:hypothetical protein n=1 Tax=Spiroplasma endosymbiont of Villa modesta TaxID=3066293 RepID=UPI00313DE1E2
MYSIKFQIVYDFFNKKIVDIFADNGKVHDFQILKNSNLEFSEKNNNYWWFRISRYTKYL